MQATTEDFRTKFDNIYETLYNITQVFTNYTPLYNAINKKAPEFSKTKLVRYSKKFRTQKIDKKLLEVCDEILEELKKTEITNPENTEEYLKTLTETENNTGIKIERANHKALTSQIDKYIQQNEITYPTSLVEIIGDNILNNGKLLKKVYLGEVESIKIESLKEVINYLESDELKKEINEIERTLTTIPIYKLTNITTELQKIFKFKSHTHAVRFVYQKIGMKPPRDIRIWDGNKQKRKHIDKRIYNKAVECLEKGIGDITGFEDYFDEKQIFKTYKENEEKLQEKYKIGKEHLELIITEDLPIETKFNEINTKTKIEILDRQDKYLNRALTKEEREKIATI